VFGSFFFFYLSATLQQEQKMSSSGPNNNPTVYDLTQGELTPLAPHYTHENHAVTPGQGGPQGVAPTALTFTEDPTQDGALTPVTTPSTAAQVVHPSVEDIASVEDIVAQRAQDDQDIEDELGALMTETLDGNQDGMYNIAVTKGGLPYVSVGQPDGTADPVEYAALPAHMHHFYKVGHDMGTAMAESGNAKAKAVTDQFDCNTLAGEDSNTLRSLNGLARQRGGSFVQIDEVGNVGSAKDQGFCSYTVHGGLAAAFVVAQEMKMCPRAMKAWTSRWSPPGHKQLTCKFFIFPDRKPAKARGAAKRKFKAAKKAKSEKRNSKRRR